eukprot:TRINITY_DN20083_c0_g1_i1.p1 TRINITY_DN20083_c0_g1~~TRINITY_DN20083_c0_g1_i1.p1  ORF type:complete len:494 (+),score=38.81 TRINITY_DN20083_c0_g1_i1:47-1528(+)
MPPKWPCSCRSNRISDHSETWHRKSGFERPWDPLQILSWVIMILFPALFAAFVLPFVFGQFARPFIAALYGAVFIGTVILDIVVARSNAADPATFVPLADSEMYDQRRSVGAGKALCGQCRAFVDMNCKHCRACNKCVLGFDHHCKWLNNCVGGSNYSIFFCFVTLTVCTFSLQLSMHTYVFVRVFMTGEVELRALELYNLSRAGILGITCSSAALAAVALALIGHLFCFHIYLKFKGITTYDWILTSRAKRAERDQRRKIATEMEPHTPQDSTSHHTVRVQPPDGVAHHTEEGESSGVGTATANMTAISNTLVASLHFPVNTNNNFEGWQPLALAEIQNLAPVLDAALSAARAETTPRGTGSTPREPGHHCEEDRQSVSGTPRHRSLRETVVQPTGVLPRKAAPPSTLGPQSPSPTPSNDSGHRLPSGSAARRGSRLIAKEEARSASGRADHGDVLEQSQDSSPVLQEEGGSSSSNTHSSGSPNGRNSHSGH